MPGRQKLNTFPAVNDFSTCVKPLFVMDTLPHHRDVSGAPENYMCDVVDLSFPGPLLSSKMAKENLMSFIQKKTQEILQHVEEPGQKEAYLFWKIMERLCDLDRKAMMSEIAVCLFREYSCLRKKAPKLMRQVNWCLNLAQLLCSDAPDDEIREAVIQMSDELAYKGQTFASHICCVVAQQELGTYGDSSYDLIGCVRFPFGKSAIREAIERSEVYEYVLFMTSGIAQPSFQKYKAYYVSMLATEGCSALALDYCESIARAIITFPSFTEVSLMKEIILMSEKLHPGNTEQPQWLEDLRLLYKAELEKVEKCDLMQDKENISCLPESPVFHLGDLQPNFSPEEEDFKSRYDTGELLGRGGFGSVYAGVRKADGKLVAIKYVAKSARKKYITIPGETHSLPLEVALMQMVSVPPLCDNVVELLEWFDVPTVFILVLERPSHCVDLHKFCKSKGPLPEPLARDIMRQVIQAASHCCDRGVLHRDIKPQNLLINTKTLQVKIIDFGCGELLYDFPYTGYEGTPLYWPPEWIKYGQYMGYPATVWSLGVLMFQLICGALPFGNDQEIAHMDVQLKHSMSIEFRDLVTWCLAKDPCYRASLKNIMNHQWFTRQTYVQVSECPQQEKTEEPEYMNDLHELDVREVFQFDPEHDMLSSSFLKRLASDILREPQRKSLRSPPLSFIPFTPAA